MSKNIVLDVELPEEQAIQLANFCKRLCFAEIKANAENEAQAYIMRDALSQVEDSLGRHGVWVR